MFWSILHSNFQHVLFTVSALFSCSVVTQNRSEKIRGCTRSISISVLKKRLFYTIMAHSNRTSYSFVTF